MDNEKNELGTQLRTKLGVAIESWEELCASWQKTRDIAQRAGDVAGVKAAQAHMERCQSERAKLLQMIHDLSGG